MRTLLTALTVAALYVPSMAFAQGTAGVWGAVPDPAAGKPPSPASTPKDQLSPRSAPPAAIRPSAAQKEISRQANAEVPFVCPGAYGTSGKLQIVSTPSAPAPAGWNSQPESRLWDLSSGQFYRARVELYRAGDGAPYQQDALQVACEYKFGGLSKELRSGNRVRDCKYKNASLWGNSGFIGSFKVMSCEKDPAQCQVTCTVLP